jgi:hypothetical protein
VLGWSLMADTLPGLRAGAATTRLAPSR